MATTATDTRKRAYDLLADQRWRLNNLYHVVDKRGSVVVFKFNAAQQRLYEEMHYLNVILKARQLGYSTFIQIYMLDQCLFNSNITSGVIAHTMRDATAMFNKIKFAYDNLPEAIRKARPLVRDSATELAFSNGSSIRVGTSMRSGTLQFLHISELGKISAKFPEKAREIRTGALNTIDAGQVVFVESTAEGQEGDFYDMCQAARETQNLRRTLTPLDFKFHFAPWWQEPGYTIDHTSVTITAPMEKYFHGLESRHGIVLTDGQKAWYQKKAATQLGDMKREYSSTPDESFSASVEGSYYGDWIEAAEQQGRIRHAAADPSQPVHTVWDIGVGDATAIWFWQRLHKEIRIVGCYSKTGEGVPFYAVEVNKLYKENCWRRDGAIDYVPHDARVKEWGTSRTRLESLVVNGFRPVIATEMSIDDGINAVREILPICVFDEAKCAEGLKALKAYRKEWNKDAGCWSSNPIAQHWSKHYADALRYLAAAYRDISDIPEPKEIPEMSPAKFRDDLIRANEEMRR